jgi:hypothetical protein
VYMFTATHYSMIAATTDRPDISDTSKASADESQGDVGAHAGERGCVRDCGRSGDHPADRGEDPVVMKPGAYEVYRFRVDGNTLSLTQVRNVRGPVERGATTNLVRVE